MSDDDVRIEGRLTLKMTGFKNADVAARAIADAFDAARQVWGDQDENDGLSPESRDVEVLFLELFRVTEHSHPEE